MITNFKQFNENLLVPRNIEGRKEKLKQMNIKLLSQEVIDGDLILDESFMDIDAKFVKLKKVNGSVKLTGGLWTKIPEWLKDIEITHLLIGSRDIKGLMEKQKQINIRLLSQEVIDGDIEFDESFIDADLKLVKLKKINGTVYLAAGQWCKIPEWLKDVEITGSFNCSNNNLTSLENCPYKIGKNLICRKPIGSHLINISNNGNTNNTRNNKNVLKVPDYVELKGQFKN